MSAEPKVSPKIYGWCPGALRPMMSGDGLVVRIRAPMGRLSQEQAHGVAELSRQFGNGLLDISARANLQMRGVSEDGHSDLIDGLRAFGLLDDNPVAESRRNVMLAPFWTQGDETDRIARDLNAVLTVAEDLTLPGKFGFAVDCGTAPVLQDIAADIRIERALCGLILRADGAATGLPVTSDTAGAAALDLARWFLATGGAPSGRGRMKAHVACDVALPEGHDVAPLALPFNPAPGPAQSGTLVALEFGQITADTFDMLADQAPIRLTPWRMLLLEGLASCAPCDGAIFEPGDPRLRVVACTGAPGCPQALGSTRDLARELAPHLPQDAKLHVSGCTKGCAHPGPAPLTLTATGQNRFDLIPGGSAGDPAQSNFHSDQLRANPGLLAPKRLTEDS